MFHTGIDGITVAVGVEQIAGDHDHADDGAQIGVATEHFGSGEANEDGQEGIGGAGAGVDHGCQVSQPGVSFHQRLPGEEEPAGGQHVVQAHHKTAGHQGGNQRHKHIGQHLDQLLYRVHLFIGCFFDLTLGGFRNAAQLDEPLVHFIHRAAADDDLELACVGELALDQVHLEDTVHIRLGLVLQHQTQAGGAMGCADDVLGPANQLKQLLGCGLVAFFFCHDDSSPSKIS